MLDKVSLASSSMTSSRKLDGMVVEPMLVDWECCVAMKEPGQKPFAMHTWPEA